MQSYILLSSETQNHHAFLNDFYKTTEIDPLDVTSFFGETSIGIDEIKKLQKQLLLKPLRGLSKALILHNAQLMTPEAQNAFLKTLEEPPIGTYLFLLTSSLEAFLPTILSRCKIITLSEKKISLSDDEKRAIEADLTTLFSEGINKKLFLAQRIGENKDTSVQWLENAIQCLRIQLIQSPSNQSVKLVQIIEYFQEMYTIIRTTNVNPRFALEQLFLAIPSHHVY